MDLDLDPSAGMMYWTEAAPGEVAVFRARLDGTGMEGIVSSGGESPSGIAVDPSAGKIYWTDRNVGVIHRANTDGSGQETFLSSGIIDPVRIVLDVPQGRIYWTEASPADFMISRANLDDSGMELLVTGLTSPSGIDLDRESSSTPALNVTWGRLKSRD